MRVICKSHVTKKTHKKLKDTAIVEREAQPQVLEYALRQSFPQIRILGDPIDVPKGWEALVFRLFEDLERLRVDLELSDLGVSLSRSRPPLDPSLDFDLKVAPIVQHMPVSVHLIRLVGEAKRTCEICGKGGKLRFAPKESANLKSDELEYFIRCNDHAGERKRRSPRAASSHISMTESMEHAREGKKRAPRR